MKERSVPIRICGASGINVKHSLQFCSVSLLLSGLTLKATLKKGRKLKWRDEREERTKTVRNKNGLRINTNEKGTGIRGLKSREEFDFF